MELFMYCFSFQSIVVKGGITPLGCIWHSVNIIILDSLENFKVT